MSFMQIFEAGKYSVGFCNKYEAAMRDIDEIVKLEALFNIFYMLATFS